MKKQGMFRMVDRKKWGIWVETDEGCAFWAWYGGEAGGKLGHPTPFFDHPKLAKPHMEELRKFGWNYKYSIRPCFLPPPLPKKRRKK